MRETVINIAETKKRVLRLKGIELKLRVNLGRNKIIEYTGHIEDAYPAIFTVRAKIHDGEAIFSYSYSDVMTKSIKFFPLNFSNVKP